MSKPGLYHCACSVQMENACRLTRDRIPRDRIAFPVPSVVSIEKEYGRSSFPLHISYVAIEEDKINSVVADAFGYPILIDVIAYEARRLLEPFVYLVRYYRFPDAARTERLFGDFSYEVGRR